MPSKWSPPRGNMPTDTTVRVATRGSKLALAQTRRVIGWLAKLWPDLTFAETVIKTTGDRVRDVALSQVGGKGLFTKELEEALLAGSADLAVHSAKDLPTELAGGGGGLLIACYPERADPRDVLVLSQGLSAASGEGVEALPQGAQVGTSSLRRQAQLRHTRPDLRFVDLRGNLDTRLRKLEEQGLDAIVLAAAGLNRLGVSDLEVRHLPVEVCVPAVGQGALALEAREADDRVLDLLRPLDRREVRLTVTAERACLRDLEGGCQVPIGAHAWLEGSQVAMQGVVASLDGRRLVRACVQGSMKEPRAVGQRLAAELLSAGGDEILSQTRKASAGMAPDADPAGPAAD
ncbi:MAG: hydroxymethylbilane synthase [Armatimonadota bacterium]